MKRRLSPITWVLLILLAGSLHGQIRSGSEFKINTVTKGCQSQPKIAADAQGNFVVVWTQYTTQYDLSYHTDADVHARRFDSNGVGRGTEFEVNTYTTNFQQGLPSVASSPSGAFMVTWQSQLQDGSGDGVFGRRFSSAGLKLETEFKINDYTTGTQGHPSVASDTNGDFVVVWHSEQDGDGYGIFGRRYLSTGAGSEFRVNTYTTDTQIGPSVASDPAGNFVVAWQSKGEDGDSYGIFGQRFLSSGASVGTEFQVNTYTTDKQEAPSVGMDATGNFVVVWRSYEQEAPSSSYGIFGQRFSSDGAEVGTEFHVNTYTTDNQDRPSVSSAPNGDFVVVWHSLSQDRSYAGVFGQRFASDGTPRESEFQVNTYTTGNQGLPAVVMRAAEDFVVVWASTGTGIRGQRFAADLIFADGFE